MNTILIVDDERDLRDTLRDAFEDAGYAVDLASDGAEAMVKLASGEPPSVVILDILMPDVDGIQLWHHMRSTPRLAFVPVVMVTGEPGRAPEGVLTHRKPIDLRALLRTVANCCAAP